MREYIHIPSNMHIFGVSPCTLFFSGGTLTTYIKNWAQEFWLKNIRFKYIESYKVNIYEWEKV